MTELQIQNTNNFFIKYPLWNLLLDVNTNGISTYRLYNNGNRLMITESADGISDEKLHTYLQNFFSINYYIPTEIDGEAYLVSARETIKINTDIKNLKRLYNIFETLHKSFNLSGKEQWVKTDDNKYYRIINGIKFYYYKSPANRKNHPNRRKPTVSYIHDGFEIDGVFFDSYFEASFYPYYIMKIIEKNN
jgi:hypothetical protein